MSPTERADRKAKLQRLASDLRGNEHERILAAQRYRTLCEFAPQSPETSQAPARPEFNRVERALIRVGATVFFGAALLADFLQAKKRRRRGPRSAEAYRVPRNA